MEPQEKIWRGESGQKFTFSSVVADGKLASIAPFHGISNFECGVTKCYTATLFRFPLRETPTESLSVNTYSVEKLRDLLAALRKEAKILLLFLRSVISIEVFEIAANGDQSLSFRVAITEQDDITRKRSTFMHDLRSQPQQEVSQPISFIADFHVSIDDRNASDNQAGESHWLVANQVGSTDARVCEAARQQCVLPWVGTALELADDPLVDVSPGGRIFCFIPMPDMASSGLPVHVNGTFGVNDDRRNLKWPDEERKNDPAADWNVMLVTDLLPSCYASLLLTARYYLQAEMFYKAWPDISNVEEHWNGLLAVLLNCLLSEATVWTERIEALKQVGQWIKPDDAFFIKQDNVPRIVRNTLTQCSLKLVELPQHIWNAISLVNKQVKEASPYLARELFRKHHHTYCDIDQVGKRVLLKYCLSDSHYENLSGVVLLPRADGSFIAFQSSSLHSADVYLCSSEFPQYLLPNLEEHLVDVTADPELQSKLEEVAHLRQTQLKRLTVGDVSKLLDKSMPAEWKSCCDSEVVMPHLKFPTKWFENFWNWVNLNKLEADFVNKLTLPVLQRGQQTAKLSFRVTKLSQKIAVVFVPSSANLSPTLLSVMDKLNVKCCAEDAFPYLQWAMMLKYLKPFDAGGLLDAVGVAHSQPSSLSSITFTAEEAESLRSFLSNSLLKNTTGLSVLLHLSIFSATSGKLYSVNQAALTSALHKAVVEHQRSSISSRNFPSSVVIFSSSDTEQVKLLKHCGFEPTTDIQLLIEVLQNVGHFCGIEFLMQKVLDVFDVLKSKDERIVYQIQSLPFLNGAPCKSPAELYSPSSAEMCALFKGEAKFPMPPFDKHIQALEQCGLCTSVTAQEIVEIIVSLCSSSIAQPQSAVAISRVKAVLNYIGNHLIEQLHVKQKFTIPNVLLYKCDSLTQALKYLAQHFNWLPVAQRPVGYPSCLQWKGDSHESCCTSMSASTLALTAEQSRTLPYIAGSQVLVVDPPLHPQLLSVFTSNCCLATHVIEHFKLVICLQKDLEPSVLEKMLQYIYQFLSDLESPPISASFLPWIWIKKDQKFVRPEEVALQENSSFRHNLEPYVHILPDNLSEYASLFRKFGVEKTISQTQIVSVLQKIKDSGGRLATDWDTVMSILNWLTKNGTEVCVSDPGSLFVPVDSDEETLNLVCADKVVYTDNEFLKEFTESLGSGESYTFVHECVHPKLAHCLGIEPLDQHLDITEDTFDDCGQSEPLTTRLRNILRDYKDGLTIIKELLQNADDAEATEVNICYDARSHNVPQRSLFFRGMSECHGPALLLHNNACFKEEDFQNITKLAGATKEGKALKIGKFGVGFCSVYHITDIPSFVSADRLVIFDPTISYLKKEIKNPSQPGKRVNFTTKAIASSKQLTPYNGLFGFNPQQSYSGTLFRLPFRTSHSELSSTCYTPGKVNELLLDIQKSSSKLMLFLQNVKRITFQQIDPDSDTPHIILDLRKETVPTPLATEHLSIQKQSLTDHSSSRESCHCEHWLVGTDVQSIDKKHATASVACGLEPGDNSDYRIQSTEGEMFCFLPLSQRTGLQVHVSANFAVINNRRGIWTSDDAAVKSGTEVEWNLMLMKTLIPRAYHRLLSYLQNMCVNGKLVDYKFYSLWPTTASLHRLNPWEHFVHSLYGLISSSNLFYSQSTGQWLTLDGSKFLRPGILCQSEVFLPCVRNTVNQLSVPIVDLPLEHQSQLTIKDGNNITEEKFCNIFFANLAVGLRKQDRNEVVRCMVEMYAAELHRRTPRWKHLNILLKAYACIPCSPDGMILKKAVQIVDKFAKFADLYDSEESMFPDHDVCSTSDSLECRALRNLGMICNDTGIPWAMLIERAKTIPELFQTNEVKALKRAELILMCTDSNQPTIEQEAAITGVKFLPVLQTPPNYPLKWYGEDHHKLLSPKQLMMAHETKTHNTLISGTQVAFVSEAMPTAGGCGTITEKAVKILQIRTSPTPAEVVNHFKVLVSAFKKQQICSAETEKICRQVYAFLDKELKDLLNHRVPDWLQELRNIPCVWNENQFIEVDVVALKWKTAGPYLFLRPTILSTRKKLCDALGLKESFTLEDYQKALELMKDDYGEKPIDEKCRNIFMEILTALLSDSSNDAQSTHIILPDERFTLHYSSNLAFNDAPWYGKDEDFIYVHESIPRPLALRLGVKAVRSRVLDKYISQRMYFRGVKFGQREELTRRIQNIIRDYPCDITLLKELLQNADDAKARKMVVILDKRTHGTQSVLSEEWKELQGPALLVWNDSEFSEEDLRGIQDLGLGSKGSKDESIGQYGIGFNVVYHLTDCPSFVTGGQTLCVLDPHCRYVPDADPLCPGRRYDDLNAGFWKDFPDMKSAYLRSGLDNCPKELLEGSLFRFPLRHTRALVVASKLIDDHHRIKTPVLDGETMSEYLSEWAPAMKQAMLFLNHVRELQFCVVDEGGSTMVTKHHFQTHFEKSACESLSQLQSKLSAFKKTGSDPCVVRYHLTLTDLSHSHSEETDKNVWLIQQGVGDLRNKKQSWTCVDKVKPRHGIAAPFLTQEPSREFRGQVFCFLPLPISSNLPVHINGHFILHSNRRELWKSTEPGKNDSYSLWNRHLFEAIASSYEDLLINCQDFYFGEKKFESLEQALNNTRLYYKLYPNVQSSGKLEGDWLGIAKDLYTNLHASNSHVLAIVGDSFTVEFHPITNNFEPSKQVYFMRHHCDESVKAVVKLIGMLITEAPRMISSCFHEVQVELPSTTPDKVYSYYIRFSHQTSPTGFPCAIESTTFQSVDNFKTFTNYVLVPTKKSIDIHVYPKPPFSHPLLLTADNQLRCFNHSNKVIRSNYSKLFPNCLDMFLHPCLLDVQFAAEYFVDCHSGCHGALIGGILTKTLPPALKTDQLSDADGYIPQLTKLWRCLARDTTFQPHLTSILQEWALLLSTDNRLFSLSCSIHPVRKPDRSQMDYYTHQPVCDVSTKLKIPFLNENIVVTSVPCPSLSDHAQILKILYHINATENISSLLTQKDVTTLVKYFREINFKVNTSARSHITSLPLFETIEGSFTSVHGKTAYKWDGTATKVGYPKWLQQQNVVFVNPSGAWTYLGSASELGIQTITGENIYTEFIFPGFARMNCAERYEHLEHIRDYLFSTAEFNASQLQVDSSQFIASLKTLRCLGEVGAPLKQVCEYASHKVEIFKTFSSHFSFLGDYFTSDRHQCMKWMSFFEALGLRTSITRAEFLKFCKKTSVRDQSDPATASTVLLKYLFSKQARDDKWQNDQSFLHEVADIPFVCSEVLPNLVWIKPAARDVTTNGDVGDRMTKLQGAALIRDADLLWTVRPIVSLPPSTSVRQIVHMQESTLLSHLQVVGKPSPSDVLENIANICRESRFAKFKLFDTYSEEVKPPTRDAKNLLDVLHTNFSFLKSIFMYTDSADAKLSELSKLSCIPVLCSKGRSFDSKKAVVLVKPCHVLISGAETFYPFLNNLPAVLADISTVLKKIGVHDSVQFHHLQVGLQTAFECSNGQELDVNSTESVKQMIMKLYSLLDENKRVKSHRTDAVATALSPLYLVSTDRMLTPTPSLLYGESIAGTSFRSDQLKLEETGLSYLHFSKAVYTFDDAELCERLPDAVRPCLISNCCVLKIVPGFARVDPSEAAEMLETSLTSFMTQALVTVFKHNFGDKYNSKMEEVLGPFIESVHIVAVKGLRANIVYSKTDVIIGKTKADVLLQDDAEGCTLYIDEKTGVFAAHDHLIELIYPVIEVFIPSQCEMQEKEKIKKVIRFALQANSFDTLQTSLGGMNIRLQVSEDGYEQELVAECGKAIPQHWCHRLDQDFHNIFQPEEWAGYEQADGRIVFVKVAYRVTGEDVPDIQTRYRVYITGELDEDGIEVSALDLYKFLRGLKKPKDFVDEDEVSSATDLVMHEGETDSARVREEVTKEDIKDIKRKLCQDLKDIWKLPEEERKKAIKRLYFKWHPDKNPDDPERAEEIFKFLQMQVSRMERGLEPEEEATADYDASPRSRGTNSWFYQNSRSWDNFARQQGHSYRSEFNFRSGRNRRRGRGRRSRGGGFYYGGGFNFGHGFNSDTGQAAKNPAKGKIWLRQAEADWSALKALHRGLSAETKISCHVCFMAYQVAEKALKGGMLAECGGSNLDNRKFVHLALALQSQQPIHTRGLSDHAARLEDYHKDTLYPRDDGDVPAETYTVLEAEKAKEDAEFVLQAIKNLPSLN